MNLTAYKKASTLGKARMERAYWDKQPKSGQTMSEALLRVLGSLTDEASIRLRSNLLRLGSSNPRMQTLWARVDARELSLQEAYQEGKVVSGRAPQTAETPTAVDCVNSRTQPLKDTRVQSLLEELQKLVLSRLETTGPPYKDKEIRSLLKEVQQLVFNRLKAMDPPYLEAEKGLLNEASRLLVFEIDEAIHSFGLSLERHQGSAKRSRLRRLQVSSQRFNQEINQAFKTLRFKATAEDLRSPGFDLDRVKKHYRGVAREIHPDRTRTASTALTQVNDAWKTICDARERILHA